MVSFVNFARIASICVGFHFGTLRGYFFSLGLLAKFEFPARISNKTFHNFQRKQIGQTKLTFDKTANFKVAKSKRGCCIKD